MYRRVAGAVDVTGADRHADGADRFDGPDELLIDAISHTAGLSSVQRETAKRLVRHEGTAAAKRYVQLAKADDLDDDSKRSRLATAREWLGRLVATDGGPADE